MAINKGFTTPFFLVYLLAPALFLLLPSELVFWFVSCKDGSRRLNCLYQRPQHQAFLSLIVRCRCLNGPSWKVCASFRVRDVLFLDSDFVEEFLNRHDKYAKSSNAAALHTHLRPCQNLPTSHEEKSYTNKYVHKSLARLHLHRILDSDLGFTK